jgi:hypothetical protein
VAEGQAQHPLHVHALPFFTNSSQLIPNRFPGLGTAVAIFSVYLVGEHFYKKLDSSSKSHH